MKFAKARFIPAYLTLALLFGVGAETVARPRPGDADKFHARVKEFESNLVRPQGWSFIKLDIPDGAVALLKPNASICRQYRTPSGTFQFLFIQCRDARDMGGHYPPVCYPSSGWLCVGDPNGRKMTWSIGDKEVLGMEYEFSHLDEQGQTRTSIIENLLILPRGTNCYVQTTDKVRAIDQVRNFAADHLQRFYGAAQIQLVFEGAVPEDTRREIFTKLIGENMKLLTVLGAAHDAPRTSN